MAPRSLASLPTRLPSSIVTFISNTNSQKMARHFCLCLSLKTGVIVMAFLNMLQGVLELVVAAIELSNIKKNPHTFQNLSKKLDVVGKVCNSTSICKNMGVKVPSEEPGLEGSVTLYISCIILGVLTFFNGILLLQALLKAKEKYVLFYLLLGSITLFVVCIYSGINMFRHGILAIVFLVSLYMIYGQIAMYHFYEEIVDYNTVKSGVIEIAFNGEPNSVIEVQSSENTAV